MNPLFLFQTLKLNLLTEKSFFNQIKNNEGNAGFYRGIKPLWGRQIPYTIVKFVAFEKIVAYFYANIFTKPKSEYSKGT